MNMTWSPEVHPHWYKDIPEMHYLILGSFPPHPSKRQYPFFYPNGRNRFWRILADLAGMQLQWTRLDEVKAVQERLEIMKKLKVGVQNLGLEIERRGTSALDTDIKITKFHDILSIIDNHPELKKILLPGYSAFSSTARSFLRYLSDNGVAFSPNEPIKSESNFRILLGDRSLECIVLNSTSTACRVNYSSLLEQFRRSLQ
jgi:hypoxanthine-DNA glycosylase